MGTHDLGLWLVNDGHDLPAHAGFVAGLADPTSGRAIVNVTPGGRNLMWLARDVMKGLGRDVQAAGTPRNSQELWRWVICWSAAEDITDLVVDRAHLLDPRNCRRLLDLATMCRANLWLICQTAAQTRGQRELLRDWPVTAILLRRVPRDVGAPREPAAKDTTARRRGRRAAGQPGGDAVG